MSDEYTYYRSISYHVVNLRLKNGFHKMLQNHSSMMLFLVSDEAIHFPSQRYRPHTKSLKRENIKKCSYALNRKSTK